MLDLRDGARADALLPIDAVIDAAGGDKQRQAIAMLKPGGFIVSSVSPPDPLLLKQQSVRGTFFLVKATTHGLRQIADLVDRGVLLARVGTVLPLSDAQLAHQMLDGIKPYVRGKIVLAVNRCRP